MISKDNAKITFVIAKELRRELVEEALLQDRSLSNMIARILKYYLKNKSEINKATNTLDNLD